MFVAGDDDQSLYSFRFASGAGIHSFPDRYPGTGRHQLDACFRCPPQVLAASMSLIHAHPAQNRIPKRHHSLYAEADPPVQGMVGLWRFGHAVNEARAISHSCKKLIDAGMNPRDILILLSNQRRLTQPLLNELVSWNAAVSGRYRRWRPGQPARLWPR